MEQLPTGGMLVIMYSLLTGFLMNFAQAIYFRKAFIRFLHNVPFVLGRYGESGSRLTAILIALAKALKMASIL